MFSWARLKNTPILWPAKVLHCGRIAARVFVKSDDSEFDVKLSNLLPFSQDEDFKEKGIEKLQKKGMLSTLNSFKEDVKWAIDENNSVETAVFKKKLLDGRQFDKEFSQKTSKMVNDNGKKDSNNNLFEIDDVKMVNITKQVGDKADYKGKNADDEEMVNETEQVGDKADYEGKNADDEEMVNETEQVGDKADYEGKNADDEEMVNETEQVGDKADYEGKNADDEEMVNITEQVGDKADYEGKNADDEEMVNETEQVGDKADYEGKNADDEEMVNETEQVGDKADYEGKNADDEEMVNETEQVGDKADYEGKNADDEEMVNITEQVGDKADYKGKNADDEEMVNETEQVGDKADYEGKNADDEEMVNETEQVGDKADYEGKNADDEEMVNITEQVGDKADYEGKNADDEEMVNITEQVGDKADYKGKNADDEEMVNETEQVGDKADYEGKNADDEEMVNETEQVGDKADYEGKNADDEEMVNETEQVGDKADYEGKNADDEEMVNITEQVGDKADYEGKNADDEEMVNITEQVGDKADYEGKNADDEEMVNETEQVGDKADYEGKNADDEEMVNETEQVGDKADYEGKNADDEEMVNETEQVGDKADYEGKNADDEEMEHNNEQSDDKAADPDYFPIGYENIEDILGLDEIVSASESEDESDGSNYLTGMLNHWKKVEDENTVNREPEVIVEGNLEDEINTENETAYDKNYPEIYIKRVLKSDHKLTKHKKTGNRVYNSLHCCLFCKKYFLHIRPHLVAKHNHITEVSNAIADKSGAKFDRLRILGDDTNNKKVLKEKKGQLLLRRRPVKDFTIDDFGPCPNCRDWVSKSNIKRHQKACTRIEESIGNQTKRNLLLQSDIASGRFTSCASQLLKEEVCSIMTNDEITKIAQNDELILALGEYWLRQNIDNRLKRAQYASQRMRLAAKLLAQLRKTENCKEINMSLWEFLKPSHFDDVVNASLELAIPLMDDEEQLKSPSNCLKLKYDLIRLTNFKWSFIVKKNLDDDQRKDCKNMIKLMTMEYKTRVTKLGYAVLMKRSFTKTKQIPTPSDIELLNRHVHAELCTVMLNPSNFKQIVTLVQCRLLCYNKRRSGEIDAISISNFRSRRKELSDVDKSLIGELSTLEKHLLSTQDLMIVRGKRGRGVPVIIPEDCHKPLEFLANTEVREKVKILKDNTYLFPNSSIGASRSYESLKKITDELNLQHPENITSVTMRKYTATLSQVIDLNGNQLDWLCKHLGHTKRVHKEHYQTMSGFIERVQVSKLLLVQDLNLTKHFVGKKLDDISFEDVLLESDSEPGTSAIRKLPEEEEEKEEEDEDENDNLSPVLVKSKKQRLISNSKRVRWTREQTEELSKFFQKHFEAKTTPRKAECLKVMKKSKYLNMKHWTDIVKKISNVNHK